ncbi:MAG TPA: ATP-binding protein [Drouetiella sp.]
MKLAVKGLLIVSVPVIAQLTLVATMSLLIWHADDLAVQQANAKAILSDCEVLTQSALDCVQRQFTKDDYYSPLSDRDIRNLRDQVSGLREKLSAEKRQTPEFQQLSKITDEFIPFLKDVKDHKFDQGETFRSEKLLFSKMDETTNLLGSIISSVNTIHRNDPEESLRARIALRIALGSFVVLNVILTIVLAYFASISIRKPLAVMAMNADRISTRKTLKQPLQGKDELSDMDSLLHQVDQSIDEALTSERNLIEYAGHLICSIDKHGKFKQINPYSEQLLGIAPGALLETSALDVIFPEDCDKVDRLFSDSDFLSDQKTVSEVRMVRHDNLVLDTIWSTSWSNAEQSLFCVIQDVTERKRIEQIKQDFLAMISHDLRTPLMSVQSSIEMIHSGAVGPVAPQAQTQLQSANRSADHLIGLVNDLLDFEKLEAGRMTFDTTVVSLGDVYKESLQLVQALTTETKARIEIPGAPLKARCDEHKLVQVMVNLLSNAMKHSGTQGTIRIENKTVGDQIEISIHDEGPGVPRDYRTKIFIPFEQISQRASAKLGTGLGLAICKLIVEGQGGTIGVRSSTQLSGSEFWLTLPKA